MGTTPLSPLPPSAPAPRAAEAAAPRNLCRGSETTTDGLRVTVRPAYIPEHSEDRKFIFSYQIAITNGGSQPVQLLSRHWTIIDSAGRAHEVHGDGVVGQQPTLRPGQTFQYESFCPLKTMWGTMEGAFKMRREDGTEFAAQINRFYLVSA